jgi:hypothetical protein
MDDSQRGHILFQALDLNANYLYDNFISPLVLLSICRGSLSVCEDLGSMLLALFLLMLRICAR